MTGMPAWTIWGTYERRHPSVHPIETGKADVAVSIIDDVSVKVAQRAARIQQWRHVHMSEQPSVAHVTTRLIRQRIGLAILCFGAARGVDGAVQPDSNKVSEGLRRVVHRFVRLRRVGTEYGRDIDRDVLQYDVRICRGGEVATGPGVRNPRGRGIQTFPGPNVSEG